MTILTGMLSGCAAQAVPAAPLPGSELREYVTATGEAAIATQPAPAGAQTPFPTATPFTYSVVANDTLTGIAQHFGLRLEDLMAANPGVSPTGLTVGMTLTIPTGPQDVSGGAAAPTAVPLEIGAPACYPTLDQGLWCFLPVTNPYADMLENITAQITLSDAAGATSATQAAIGALDILPPGRSMPLTAFFAPPIPAGVTATARLTTAIRLPASDRRYVAAVAQNTLVSVDWSGRLAQISGRVSFVQSATARQVWVLAVAYDDAGHAVGYRRWEAAGAAGPGDLPFAFSVASARGRIARVEVLVEARP